MLTIPYHPSMVAISFPLPVPGKSWVDMTGRCRSKDFTHWNLLVPVNVVSTLHLLCRIKYFGGQELYSLPSFSEDKNNNRIAMSSLLEKISHLVCHPDWCLLFFEDTIPEGLLKLENYSPLVFPATDNPISNDRVKKGKVSGSTFINPKALSLTWKRWAFFQPEKKGMGEGWEDESQLNFPKQTQVEKESAILWLPFVSDSPSQRRRNGSGGRKTLHPLKLNLRS